MPASKADFALILSELAASQAEFVVIGGAGAVLQGAPISTVDVDIVQSRAPDSVARLVSALDRLHAYYREHPDRKPSPDAKLMTGPGHHLLMTDAGPIDVLGEAGPGQTFDELKRESLLMDIAPGVTIRVLSLEAIVRMKEALGRDKDRIVIPILRRTIEERTRLSQ
jgi:hypothetical protein